MTNTNTLDQEGPAFLSVRDVSRFLGVAAVSVYRLAARRALPVHRFLRRLRFRREDVLAWIEARRTPSQRDDVWQSEN